MNEFTQGLENMDPTELMLGAGVVGGILVLKFIGRILWFFISAIGHRKMFQKAGEAGWKAFIPLYNDFVCFKFSWNTKLFWPFAISSLMIYFLPGSDYLVTGILTWICMIRRENDETIELKLKREECVDVLQHSRIHANQI